jgi:DNA-directed RNA polymerase specialized sigma24 family protein
LTTGDIDWLLVAWVASGDERALAALAVVTVRSDPHALGVLGGSDDAEDVCADVFLHLWRRVGTCDPTGTLTSLLTALIEIPQVCLAGPAEQL